MGVALVQQSLQPWQRLEHPCPRFVTFFIRNATSGCGPFSPQPLFFTSNRRAIVRCERPTQKHSLRSPHKRRTEYRSNRRISRRYTPRNDTNCVTPDGIKKPAPRQAWLGARLSQQHGAVRSYRRRLLTGRPSRSGCGIIVHNNKATKINKSGSAMVTFLRNQSKFGSWNNLLRLSCRDRSICSRCLSGYNNTLPYKREVLMKIGLRTAYSSVIL